jgi:integrase
MAAKAGSGATRTAQALTAKIIEALKADPAGPYRVPDSRTRGLGLRVAVDGGKTWDFVYRIKGAGVRRRSLGRYEDIGIERARERANDLAKAARQGQDLIAKEEAADAEYDQSFTVARLIDEYAKRRLTGRLRSARSAERLIRQTLAPMLARKAADIKRRDLRGLFDAIADRYPVAAEKRRTLIQTMFRWSVQQDITESDPSAGLASYGQPAARERVLDHDEIKALWHWLETGMPGHIADILKLQLCLGARVGEVCGMTVGEFEQGGALWRLPATRSKNGLARLTPILGLAKEIVRHRRQTAIEARRDRLFVSRRGIGPTTSDVGVAIINRRDRTPVAKFASHDLRRTVATEMAKLDLPLDLIATVLGQKAGGAGTQTLIKHYIVGQFLDRKIAVRKRLLKNQKHLCQSCVNLCQFLAPARGNIRPGRALTQDDTGWGVFDTDDGFRIKRRNRRSQLPIPMMG